MRRILIIVAHSDDEVLGCGGTIAKHSDLGDLVNIIFLADGVNSRSDAGLLELEIRKANAKEACKVLGVNNISFGQFPDNKLDTLPLIEIVKYIEAGLAEFNPEIIYTHSALDLNIDHQIVNRAVITATRPQGNCSVKTILSFEILSSTEWFFSELMPAFKPNWFEDISKTLDRKIKAIEIYRGELRNWPHPRSIEGIKHLAGFRGATIGANAAEAFMLLRHIK
jgi:LmbE family N-acetylglucosaminyl deacetylase